MKSAHEKELKKLRNGIKTKEIAIDKGRDTVMDAEVGYVMIITARFFC